MIKKFSSPKVKTWFEQIVPPGSLAVLKSYGGFQKFVSFLVPPRGFEPLCPWGHSALNPALFVQFELNNKISAVGREGFEPSHLAAYGPEPYVSAISPPAHARSVTVAKRNSAALPQNFHARKEKEELRKMQTVYHPSFFCQQNALNT